MPSDLKTSKSGLLVFEHT